MGSAPADQFIAPVPVFFRVNVCGLGFVPEGVVRLIEVGVTWKWDERICTLMGTLTGELSVLGALNVNVVVRVCGGRLAVLKVKVSVVDAPAANAPDVGLTLTQVGKLLVVQFRVRVPVFLSVRACELGFCPRVVVRLMEVGVT